MSDRRPENRPRTKYPMTEFMKLVDCPADPPHANSCECGGYQYWTEAATLPELLAAVRRGVESGEIEGLPLFCAAHWCALTPDESTCSLYQRVEGMDTCSIEYRILLIPTTDSERHP